MLIVTLMLLAGAQAAQAPAVANAAQPDPNKIVCRNEKEAHTRIPTRICRTQAEWDQIAAETQADLGKSANQRMLPPNPRGR